MGSVLATMVGALIGGLGFARALESAIPSVDASIERVYEDDDELGYFLYEDADDLPKCPNTIPDWMLP